VRWDKLILATQAVIDIYSLITGLPLKPGPSPTAITERARMSKKRDRFYPVPKSQNLRREKTQEGARLENAARSNLIEKSNRQSNFLNQRRTPTLMVSAATAMFIAPAIKRDRVVAPGASFLDLCMILCRLLRGTNTITAIHHRYPGQPAAERC
jgi:hypothetical protein